MGADTVASVLRAVEGLRYRPVLVLIAATGLRRGEVLGLAWRQVNLRRHAALHRDCRREGWRRRCRGPHPAHSAAVAWLEAGVHIKAVADLLGHSSISITGDICGHTSDATTRAAVEGLTNELGLYHSSRAGAPRGRRLG